MGEAVGTAAGGAEAIAATGGGDAAGGGRVLEKVAQLTAITALARAELVEIKQEPRAETAAAEQLDSQ